MVLKMRKNLSPPLPGECDLTRCMKIFSPSWAPNVIWCLRGGPRRFSELRADIPPISAKVLSTRLRDLEQRGVITRTVLDTSPPSTEYALTARGEELIPALDSIVRVGRELRESGFLY